jgi:hypothetical protein
MGWSFRAPKSLLGFSSRQTGRSALVPMPQKETKQASFSVRNGKLTSRPKRSLWSTALGYGRIAHRRYSTRNHASNSVASHNLRVKNSSFRGHKWGTPGHDQAVVNWKLERFERDNPQLFKKKVRKSTSIRKPFAQSTRKTVTRYSSRNRYARRSRRRSIGVW